MFKIRNLNRNEKSNNKRNWFFVTGYPVSVSGMITLPVSSSVYQSMVANIQQIHTNSDGTLCITPMQVQKSGHQSSVGQISSISSIASHTNNSCSTNSDSSSLIANCQQGANSQYAITPHIQPILSCDNQMNTNSNLLELCRVLSQSNQHEINSSGCFSIPLSTNHYHLSSSSNEKKVTKSKRNSSRNPFNMISANYESGTSSNNNQQVIRNNRNQIIHDPIKCQEDSNDTNNNINYEDSIDVINGDLKCGIISSNELSHKISKSDDDLSSIHFDEIESKNIKSECEIDAA